MFYLFLVLPCAAVFAVVHNSRKKPGEQNKGKLPNVDKPGKL